MNSFAAPIDQAQTTSQKSATINSPAKTSCHRLRRPVQVTSLARKSPAKPSRPATSSWWRFSSKRTSRSRALSCHRRSGKSETFEFVVTKLIADTNYHHINFFTMKFWLKEFFLENETDKYSNLLENSCEILVEEKVTSRILVKNFASDFFFLKNWKKKLFMK